MLTLCFHLQYFCLFVGTRVQLQECIFVFSKRLIGFVFFGIDKILIFVSLFYQRLT